MNCETCKHYREVEMRSLEGEIVTDGYCHASATFAKKTRTTPACKRWAANPDKI